MNSLLKYIFFIFLLFQFSTNISAETKSKWITKTNSENKPEVEKIKDELEIEKDETKSKWITKTNSENKPEIKKDETKSLIKKKMARSSAMAIDTMEPVIFVVEKIEANGGFILEGKVFDNTDPCKQIVLHANEELQEINNDCSFKISLNSNNINLVILEAADLQGNKSEVKKVQIVSQFTSNEKYYALVIGNNSYKYLEPLTAAVNDAQQIAKILEDKYNFEVELLLDANSKKMENAIINLRNKVTMDDNLLIYYAGHGMRDNDAIPKQAYWIPIDGGKSLDGNWINTRTIESYISGIKAKHILLMVDSCYAGSFRGSDFDFPTNSEVNDTMWVKKMLNTRTRLLITSGTDQPVLDEVIDNHSWFAYLFVRFLNENKNYINATTMFEKLKKKHGSFNQNPKLNRLENIGDKNGDFFFFAKN